MRNVKGALSEMDAQALENNRRRQLEGSQVRAIAPKGPAGRFQGLQRILKAVEQFNSRPVKTYVTLTDLDAQQKLRSDFRNATSLRSR